MPAANIEINAVAAGGADVTINVAVQLSNADIGGETSYLWEILDQPEGAADALTNPAIENPLFTPTKEGSYRIRLTVNAGQVTEAVDTAVVSVLEFRTGDRIPAATELLERSTSRGWAEAVNRTLRRVGVLRGDPGLVACVAAAGMSVGSVVRVMSGMDTLKVGLPGEETVPKAELLGVAGANGVVGVIVAVCDGGAIAAGKLVLVRVYGLVELPELGAPSVGDPVYVDTLGEPTLFETGIPRPRWVGRVVDTTGGVQFRWFIDGYDGRWDPRLTPAVRGYDVGVDWARDGGTLDRLRVGTTIAGSSRWILPLDVHPGEVLYRVEAQVQLDNVAGLIDAYLCRGTATAGAGAIAPATTTPGVVGPAVLKIAGGGAFTLPYTVTAGESVWLGFAGNGGGGFARFVGSATAYTRPA